MTTIHIAPFVFPGPPPTMTHEWEDSEIGQAFVQRDNENLAAEPLYRSQPMLVSRIHIRSFLRGWNAAIDFACDGDPNSPVNISERVKGQKPSSYSIAFMEAMRQMRSDLCADVFRTIGIDDIDPYNQVVTRLKRERPEEYPSLGYYGDYPEAS